MRLQLSAARLLSLAVVLVALLLSVSATALAQTPITPVTPPAPLSGKELYAENCAPCHGATGKADGASAAGLSVPPTAFADPTALASKSLVEIFDITKNGNMPRMMPPWKNRLSDQQIWDTVAYVWTLHTAAAQVEMGKAVYAENCASCHGPDGQGAATGGNLADFAVTSQVSQASWAQAVANGKGNMPGFADKLDAAAQTAALEYVRSLAFAGSMFRAPLAPGAGVISGVLLNGTSNAPLPNIAIELGVFDQTALLEQRTTTTDAVGRYQFTELPTDASLAFGARVQYPAGVPYSSDIVSFEAGQTALDLPLTVFETTSDPGGIRAERVHFIVEFDAGQALVAELLVFNLDGSRTYVGNRDGVLRFPLPAQAQGLQISGDDQSGRFTVTAEGFVDRLPLAPGQNVRQIIYQYALPYTGEQLDFVRSLPYPVTAVNALISDVGEQVVSAELANQGVRETENGNYINLTGANLGADQPITIRLSQLPSASASAAAAAGTGGRTTTNRILLGVLIGLVAAIGGLLVALPFLRRRGLTVAAPAAGDSRTLVDALARLDLAHEGGQLTEATYREQRLRLKAQLRDALKQEV